jgi:hypothetical protein
MSDDGNIRGILRNGKKLTTFINISTTGRKSYRLFKTHISLYPFSAFSEMSSSSSTVLHLLWWTLNLLGPNQLWEDSPEDFDEITTYSKMSPDIRILDFSDAFTSNQMTTVTALLSAGHQVGYFRHNRGCVFERR